jgi:hypothetical protein
MIDKRYAKMPYGPVPTFVRGPDGVTRKVMYTNTPEDLVGSFIEDGFVDEADRYRELYVMYKLDCRRINQAFGDRVRRIWAEEYAQDWVSRWLTDTEY